MTIKALSTELVIIDIILIENYEFSACFFFSLYQSVKLLVDQVFC